MMLHVIVDSAMCASGQFLEGVCRRHRCRRCLSLVSRSSALVCIWSDPYFRHHRLGGDIWYAVAELYEAGLCDREVAGSTPARGCCVPTPTQRAIPPGSVNE